MNGCLIFLNMRPFFCYCNYNISVKLKHLDYLNSYSARLVFIIKIVLPSSIRKKVVPVYVMLIEIVDKFKECSA